MYNLAISGDTGEYLRTGKLFGDKYDLTDDLSQANVLVVCDSVNAEIPDSKLLFAVCDMTEAGLSEDALRFCSDRGIAVFRNDSDSAAVTAVRDFIENGNAAGCAGFPDIDLGPFGSDMCRVIIMMKGIDDPILLAAMMFSGLDVRAIAGGLFTCQNPGVTDDAQAADQNPDSASDSLYGCALVALREPITRIPHLDGVIKVRVLQDI